MVKLHIKVIFTTIAKKYVKIFLLNIILYSNISKLFNKEILSIKLYFSPLNLLNLYVFY